MYKTLILIATLFCGILLAVFLTKQDGTEVVTGEVTGDAAAAHPIGLPQPETEPELDNGRSPKARPLPPEAPSRRLVGVIGAAAELDRKALIEFADGSQHIYRIGDAIPADGAVLEEVMHDRALLRTADDQLITLYRHRGSTDVADAPPEADYREAAAASYQAARTTPPTADGDCDDCAGLSAEPDQESGEPEEAVCDAAATGREEGACAAAAKQRSTATQPEESESAAQQAYEAQLGQYPGGDQDLPGSESPPQETPPPTETGSDRDAERSQAPTPAEPENTFTAPVVPEPDGRNNGRDAAP